MTDDTTFDAGMAVRRRVLGNAHVDRAIAAAGPLDHDFQRFITEMAWGSVWARETFDDRTRSMITIAILAALGRDELDLHLQATANTEVTPEEVAEIMLHVAVYAGVPAANHALSRAKELLAEPSDGTGADNRESPEDESERKAGAQSTVVGGEHPR